MKELIGLLQNVPSDNFCPEMFGEWFVEGQLEDKHFDRLTPERCDDVFESINERYGKLWADRFDDKALPLLSM